MKISAEIVATLESPAMRNILALVALVVVVPGLAAQCPPGSVCFASRPGLEVNFRFQRTGFRGGYLYPPRSEIVVPAQSWATVSPRSYYLPVNFPVQTWGPGAPPVIVETISPAVLVPTAGQGAPSLSSMSTGGNADLAGVYQALERIERRLADLERR